MHERKRLLQHKLNMNKQKSQRAKLLDLLPQDIAIIIEKSDFITSPKVEEILNKVNAQWNYELNRADFAIKYNGFRQEFSWEQEVIDFVQGIAIEKQLVYLFLGIEDCPMFLVDGKWALKKFNILWACINNADIWIISQDFSYGILVSRYGGYLEYDPNPKEIVYAITKWHRLNQ